MHTYTRTINKETGEVLQLIGGAYNSVLAAYAMEHNDYNTTTYHSSYAHLVTKGATTYRCGNWIARRDDCAD